jgi:t-SNARE complex subunit (syntaxin)
MSLATLDKRETVAATFESLAQSVEELVKQVQRTKTTADELEQQIDYRKFQRLQKSSKDNRTKFDSYTRTLTNLCRADPKKEDPGRRFEEQIEASLDTIHRILDALEVQLGPISVHQEEMEEQAKAARAEEQRLAAIQAEKSKEQEEAEQMAADLQMLSREAKNIAQDMQTVNELTHQVDGLITDQHEVMEHVETTIQEAVGEMKAGNEELVTAETDQKSSSKMIWIILGIVITVVVIVAVVLSLKFTGSF